MIEKSIHSSRGEIYYWIRKHSDPNARNIIFSPGLTADHRMFEKQVEYFQADYTVISWDIPLHGKSRPYNSFTYENAAYELKSILDNEFLKSAILIGQSMGGYVCQEFAIQYPEMVDAFIGIGTTPFGLSYYSKSDRWWLRQVEPMAKWYPYNFLVKTIAKSATRTKYAYSNMMLMLSSYSKEELCRLIGIAYGDIFYRKEVVHFNFPVLLLVGEFDKTGKVIHYNKKWQEREKYLLKFISNAAHNANVDNFEEVNKVIANFLTGCNFHISELPNG
ncbi:alpha/beta hydrolase [uncultured Clostridium sp.]|uniref:alpha/beta fold hydrolase n=1 Tax=uncultured Clostridium sp. TaxID=59620 RepID=UPI0028ED716C|nr:alpha/beta hydrolase [uncultured Clostridium sp.]